MLPEIKKLLELQAVDERLDELSGDIEHLRAQCCRIEEKTDAERKSVDLLRKHVRELEHDSRMKNLEVDELDLRIRSYRKRLDEGIISFKEMEDLRAKIESERSRISRMEDEALGLMESIEAKRAALAEAETALAAREADLRVQRGKLAAEIEDATEQCSVCNEQRVQLGAEMSAYLFGQYENLHAKFANPIAQIHRGTCTGCKLKVSANTAERARGSLGVVTCEHCSRILYSS